MLDKYFLTCVWSREFNTYVAEIRELGCIASGQTFIDAIKAVKKQAQAYLEVSEIFNEKIPMPMLA